MLLDRDYWYFVVNCFIQLQVKFEEKEKQLEKEINANNLLKQRLVSAGTFIIPSQTMRPDKQKY